MAALQPAGGAGAAGPGQRPGGGSASPPARSPQPRLLPLPPCPPAPRTCPRRRFPARPRSARLGSARLRSPGSSVISGSSQEAIRLPWREVSPRDPSLRLAPENATPGRVRPWGRRPPGIPLPRAAPRGSPPPPLAFPTRGSALGEMPPLGPPLRPPARIHHPRASVPGGPGEAHTGGDRSSLTGRARGTHGEVGAMGKGGRRGIRPRCVLPFERSPGSFEGVPKRVSAGDRWYASGNGRDVTAKLKTEADVPLRGRVFHREHLPPPSRTKQKAQTKSEGSS